MTRLQQVIIAMNSFSMGILLPVFNLVLLEKGASLQTLPLLLAIYAITVLCLELPSGICADIYGRKAVFLLSCVFQFISFSLLIAVSGMTGLIFAITFHGLGRAFSSGSLDALFINQAIDTQGEAALAKVTSRMAVLEGGGLAVGGIAGGILSDVTGSYLMNIVFRLVFTVMVFILCLAFVKEQYIRSINHCTSLMGHIKQGKQIIFTTSKLGFIFLGAFFAGFLLCTIEVYWQPAFMQIQASKNNTWVLGGITFLGFFAAAAGNTVAQKLLDKYSESWWKVYNICRMFFSVCILIFAFQKSAFGFAAGYAGVYLLLGVSNVTENTLMNKLTPNHMRASVLSLSSFVTQIGVLSASLFSSIMILRLQFTGIWLAAGGLLGAYAIIGAVFINNRPPKNRNKTEMLS